MSFNILHNNNNIFCQIWQHTIYITTFTLGTSTMQNKKSIAKTVTNYALDEFHSKNCPADIEEVILDTLVEKLGLELSGATFPLGKNIYERSKSNSKKGKSSIVYYGDKVTPPVAAMVNATFGHMNDFDDTSIDALVHPAGVNIATAIAIGEHAKSSGAEVFKAIYIGMEIMIRLGISIRDAHVNGFYTPTIVGPFASAIVTGLLLKMSHKDLLSAFSIAGNFCGGVEQFTDSGGTIKRALLGIAAKNGIEACYLTMDGFTGPEDIVEGAHGLTSFSRQPKISAITEGLGSKYYTKRLLHKAYNCCHSISTPIQAALQLLDKHNIEAADIMTIKVGLGKFAYDHTHGIKEPKDDLSAQFCVGFVLALSIIDTPPHLYSYTAEVLKNDKILELSRRISVYEESAFCNENESAFATKVTITTHNGNVFSAEEKYPKGSLENPLAKAELKSKFYSCLTGDLATRKEQIFDTITNIRNYKNIAELTKYLKV